MVVNQNSLSVLPLRDIVVFPNSTTPLFVGREKSINALDFAMNNSKKIVLLTQKNPDVDEPYEKDLYSIGTVAEVLQLLKLPDGTVKILVEGKSVCKVIEFQKNEKLLNAQVENCILVEDKNNNLLSQALVNKFNKLSKSSAAHCALTIEDHSSCNFIKVHKNLFISKGLKVIKKMWFLRIITGKFQVHTTDMQLNLEQIMREQLSSTQSK